MCMRTDGCVGSYIEVRYLNLERAISPALALAGQHNGACINSSRCGAGWQHQAATRAHLNLKPCYPTLGVPAPRICLIAQALRRVQCSPACRSVLPLLSKALALGRGAGAGEGQPRAGLQVCRVGPGRGRHAQLRRGVGRVGRWGRDALEGWDFAACATVASSSQACCRPSICSPNKMRASRD